jgi:hypothetical protein
MVNHVDNQLEVLAEPAHQFPNFTVHGSIPGIEKEEKLEERKEANSYGSWKSMKKMHLQTQVARIFDLFMVHEFVLCGGRRLTIESR